MKKRKNAFTLVELVAVLVIMAILAVIVTPLILSFVNKAISSANKRSVDAYGKAVELSVLSYLMDNGDYPSDLTTLTVEYTGKEVTCNVMTLNNDGSVYLSECNVEATEVRDDASEDGWYHYGVKEEIIYDAYNIGDIVTYNGIDFYVIENSDATKDSVTLLKAEPLTTDEVNTYGAGHVNMYVTDDTIAGYYQTAYDRNGYGGMAYYSSATCGYTPAGDDSSFTDEGCTTDYASSEIKYIVDGWSNSLLTQTDLKEDATGYSARLIAIEELTTNLGYDASLIEDGWIASSTAGETPSWVYNENYRYWTMTPRNSSSYVWFVDFGTNGYVGSSDFGVYDYAGVVRPVITLYKSAIK